MSCDAIICPSSSTMSGHAAARVAGLADDHVDDERGALEHGRRRIDAAELHVALKGLASHAHGEDRQAGRLQRPERVGHRPPHRVGAVGHQYDARHRQAGQLLRDALERLRDVRARALERGRPGIRHPFGGRGEPEEAQGEPAAERLAKRAPGRRAPPPRTRPRGAAPSSAMAMLRESSTTTARKFCCGSTARTTSTGLDSANSRTASTARRKPSSRARVPRGTLTAERTYAHTATAAAARPIAITTTSGQGGLKASAPCWKITGRYLKTISNRRSNTRSPDPHGRVDADVDELPPP